MGKFEIGRRGLLAGALAMGAGCATSGPAPRREIAITIDDVPLPDGPYYTGAERQRRILDGLSRAGVTEAAFYCNPSNETPEIVQQRLRAYAAAGHAIANHSWSHPNLAEVSAEAYLANIARADAVLRPMPNFKPWFRFPYLSEGDTVEKRDIVRQGLIAMGYQQGYVTADTFDWKLDMLSREAISVGHELDLDALRDLHIRTTVEGCDYADRLAVAHLGRSPKHVLLMHENDVEAMFIDDVIAALKREGWGICTASSAFEDPIAAELPDTLTLGQGRVAAMIFADNARDRYSEIYRSSFDALDAPFAAEVVRR